MKTIRYIIVLAFTINIISGFAQTRNIIWTHGLGEDSTAWQHYATIFENERDIHSVNPHYATNDHTINFSTSNFITYTNSAGTNSRNLGVGHSLGGLVLRNQERMGYNRVGGLITVNTPNYGAQILESVDDGSVINAANSGTSMLTAGPLSEIGNPVLQLGAGLVSSGLSSWLFSNRIFNDLGSNGGNAMHVDLKPNSTALNNINSYNSSLPRISMWGNETSPVHWRLVSSTMPSNSTFYNADLDISAVLIATRVRGFYQSHFINHIALAIACSVGGFWNPYCWWQVAVHTFRAVMWKQGANWMDNSEAIWCSLIKTTRQEEHQFWEQVFVPDSDYDECLTYLDEDYPYAYDCGTFEWQWVTHTVPVTYPSDGFLAKYTQIMKNNPTPNNEYEILGANHFEVLNMSTNLENGLIRDNTRTKLNEIFNRGDFFRTN